eukprot:TRINITY_DN5554_c0_g1_i3.p1 TRINITY_DN5554_c0_g1~~TRINITY_DN5554_c0_g1_i3.p1  ORF type:complete len:211 (-),score=-15.71 TRINITY_DN5554_c0_g1_i3:430-1062(-)
MQLVEKSVENWQNFMQCFVTSLLKVQVILKVVNLVFEQNFMNIYLYLFRYISQQKTRFYAIVVMHMPFQTRASKKLTKTQIWSQFLKFESCLMRDGKNNLQCMHIKLVEFCPIFWHNPPFYVDLLLVYSNLPWNNSNYSGIRIMSTCIIQTFAKFKHISLKFWPQIEKFIRFLLYSQDFHIIRTFSKKFLVTSDTNQVDYTVLSLLYWIK